jgi:hypothetical protein
MPSGSIIASGIDYITMTMKNDNPQVTLWKRNCLIYLEEISTEGGDIVVSKRLGYDGNSSGGSFVGERERDTIATFSGQDAKRAHLLLYHNDLHIARLDVQCTYQFDVNQVDIAKLARDATIRDNMKVGAARQRNATLIEDLRGGATCYVGQRTSQQFARIYNKEAESGNSAYANAWRYEVQLKNSLASQTAANFSKNEYTQEEYAAVFVKHWLRHRGIPTPWKAKGEILPLPRQERTPNEVELKLQWLRESVRPALRVLLKYGLIDDILDALGLVTPNDGS